MVEDRGATSPTAGDADDADDADGARVALRASRLEARGARVQREVQVDLRYKGHRIGRLRLDMVIDDLVVVELKSGASLDRYAMRQLHNYLRWSDYEVGLLLFFGPEPQFKRLVYTKHGKGR
jgi:GxxExxY protein